MENHENRKCKVILTRRLADQRKVDVEGVCLRPIRNGQHVEFTNQRIYDRESRCFLCTSSADEVDHLVGLRVDHLETGDSSVGVGVDESKKKNGQHVELQTRDSTTENPGAFETRGSNRGGVRVDESKKKTNQFYPFSCIDFIGISISLIFFCIDVFTDILLAKSYYDDGMMFECVLTSSLVAAAFLVTGILSSIWHTQEPSRRNICLLILMFPFATIERNITYVFHGCKSKQKGINKHYHYIEMIYNDRDASLLRMFDAFIESAPQLVLQIYLILKEQENLKDCEDISIHSHILRLLTVLSSWASVTWSVTAYYRALRVSNAMHKTRQKTIFAATGYFLWRAFEIGPRVLALVMIILMNGIIFAVTVVFHWIVVITWSFATKMRPYKKTHENIIFILFVGFVQIFSFMNVSPGKSRYHALLYYLFFYTENITILILWILAKNISFCPWIYYGSIGIVSGGLMFNLVFIISFYKLCHPNTAIC
ncbi:XK-related protein 6-like [Saccostrea echinata]|uniref:XK-related protein 6-like n=1 Tax=Saccostrea echinata TaxID=191078 RepID=UPI002A8403C4|nr:XK-related protein 6-like [Saccostrea echinata]